MRQRGGAHIADLVPIEAQHLDALQQPCHAARAVMGRVHVLRLRCACVSARIPPRAHRRAPAGEQSELCHNRPASAAT
eukprot:3884561-Prymnesium_polylepis.1